MSERPCEREKPVLVVKMDRLLDKEQQAAFAKDVERGAERLGMSALLLTGGADAHIDRDPRPLLVDMVAEQRKTNDLLTALITAMADEGAVEAESIITHDLSGRPLKKPGGHHG
ncbi:hypothetical protein [Pseudomonas aeruginosa]|uniref:hypothetical protein n=1 Tax=Pseudomonas aeruginosa TaxID=287 RepID=UPI001F18AC84|nr:hypothetical protein [Pseudomonas aeruginosa]MEE3522928.1 hypothetical protein [Pseudomonas aeruginosa]